MFHFNSGVKSELSSILASIFIDCSVFIKDVDLRKIVSLPTFKVVEVVSWGNFDGSCSKGHVNKFCICYDDHVSLRDEWVDQFLADQVLVSRVIWMDSYRNVSKHGFQSCSCNFNCSITSLNFVDKVCEVTKLIHLIFYLWIIRYGNSKLLWLL